MSNLKFCELHNRSYFEGDECGLCSRSVLTLGFPSKAAENLARHMNMDPAFELAASATFRFYGLKIVVTPDDLAKPDPDPDGIGASKWNDPDTDGPKLDD